MKAQRRATTSVLATASGRSAKRSAISSAVLKRCSTDTRRRSSCAIWAPPAMQTSASCASCMSAERKWTSLVATSGMSWRRRDRSGRARRAPPARRRGASARRRAGRRRPPAGRAAGAPPLPCRRAAGPRPAARRGRRSAGSGPRCAGPAVRAWPGRPSPASAATQASHIRCSRLAYPVPSLTRRTTCSGSGARPARRVAASGGATGISAPTIGCTPAFLAAAQNCIAPNRLASSVTATAGIAWARQAFSRSPWRTVLDSSEKAERTRRWTKPAWGMQGTSRDRNRRR